MGCSLETPSTSGSGIPATQSETLMHELTDKELDNIKKVISNINVGQFTDLIGQEPPADFDLESYEDHAPGSPEAPDLHRLRDGVERGLSARAPIYR